MNTLDPQVHVISWGFDAPGFKEAWRSDPITITDLRFKWYIRLWCKIKLFFGIGVWRPI